MPRAPAATPDAGGSPTRSLPAAEPGLAGLAPQLGAVMAALRPPPLQQRHIGDQRTPPGPPCLGLTTMYQFAHGIPGQAEFAGNRLDRPALAMDDDSDGSRPWIPI